MMGGVSVLHPQDLFNHHTNPMISPAIRSEPLGRRPTSNVTHTTNNTPRSSSSSSNRTKRSPPKKNSLSPLKEPSHNHNTKPRSTPKPKPKPSDSNNTNNHNHNHNHHHHLVMGQVKLLKRGETLPPPPLPPPPSIREVGVDLKPKEPQPKPNRRAASGKKNEKVGAFAGDVSFMSPADVKRICFPDCYAGSAFVSSPPPSSLPVPAFFKKKSLVLGDVKTNSSSTIDEATSDLLRLLRLDLS